MTFMASATRTYKQFRHSATRLDETLGLSPLISPSELLSELLFIWRSELNNNTVLDLYSIAIVHRIMNACTQSILCFGLQNAFGVNRVLSYAYRQSGLVYMLYHDLDF